MDMKNILLASAGLIAMNVFAPAMAADLATAPVAYVKARPPVATVLNWTGFYVGGFSGYAGQNGDHDDMKGGFAGGAIGYNWQTSNVVYGLEADAGWADVNTSISVPSITIKSKIDSLGSVRGRLGFALDKVLFYGTGGYAWANGEVSLSGFGVTASQLNYHSGWTVGAGVEAFIAPQWSIKGEYLYRSLGSENYFTRPSGTVELHSFQVGVNYHFGGPVATAY